MVVLILVTYSLLISVNLTAPSTVNPPVIVTELLNDISPPTSIRAFKETSLSNVVCPVTVKVLSNTVAPDTSNVLANAAAPDTSNELANAAAPDTSNVLSNTVAPATVKSSFNETSPPTSKREFIDTAPPNEAVVLADISDLAIILSLNVATPETSRVPATDKFPPVSP